jgi:hypothetical protein
MPLAIFDEQCFALPALALERALIDAWDAGSDPRQHHFGPALRTGGVLYGLGRRWTTRVHVCSSKNTPPIPLIIMSATNTHGMIGLSKILVLLIAGPGVMTCSSHYRREYNTLSHRRLAQGPVGDALRLLPI